MHRKVFSSKHISACLVPRPVPARDTSAAVGMPNEAGLLLPLVQAGSAGLIQGCYLGQRGTACSVPLGAVTTHSPCSLRVVPRSLLGHVQSFPWEQRGEAMAVGLRHAEEPLKGMR